MLSWRSSTLALLAAVFALGLFASPALAQKDIGKIGKNVGDSLGGLYYMMRMIAYLAGFSLVVIAIVQFANVRNSPQASMMQPVLFLVSGVLLVSITAFIGSGSATIFGSDKSDSSLKDLESSLPEDMQRDFEVTPSLNGSDKLASVTVNVNGQDRSRA